MKIHQHPSTNFLLGKPVGMRNCDTIPATMMVDEVDQTVTIATFWRPSEEELRLLNSGASVILFVFGTQHPPVAVGVSGG